MELSPNWPDRDVEETALRLLPEAYFRACQQGDELACRRAINAVAMLRAGDTIPDNLTDGRGPSLFFQGRRGQAVTIAMNAYNNAFDTFLRLEGPAGVSISDDDGGRPPRNSLIANYLLPHDGIYRIMPTAYGGSGRGAYSIEFDLYDPRPLTLGSTESATAGSGSLWQFEGQAGQPITIGASTPTGATPSLGIQRANGETLRYSESSAITAFFPPETGRYYLLIGNLDQTSRYTLTLQAVQPPAIAFGEAATSDTQTTELWRFSGRAGQVVLIDMTGWVPGVFDPYLNLLAADGRTLIEDDDVSSDNFNARIVSFVLPASGDYFIRAGRPGSQEPYTLLLQEVQPPLISLGETKSSNTQTDELWRFSGRAGQVVDIELTGNDFDPNLTLYASDGSVLASNDNISAQNYNAHIAAFMLPATGDYFVRAGQPGSTAPYQLSLTERRPTPAVLGSTVPTQENAAYALPVQRPGFVAISVDPAAELSLAAPGGTVLASQAPAILARLGATGVYTVSASFRTDGRPRSIAMLPITATPRPFDASRSTQGRLRAGSTDLWTLGGGEGQAVRVTAVGADFTPVVELYAPGGGRLAVGDPNGVLVAALRAAGDSVLVVRGPTGQASGPYTLTVQPFDALPGPQVCSSTGGAASYLPVRQGSQVILGRHRPVNGEESWNPGMNVYVGQQARVTELAGNDWVGCPQVRVDIDEGQFNWRVLDMSVLN